MCLVIMGVLILALYLRDPRPHDHRTPHPMRWAAIAWRQQLSGIRTERLILYLTFVNMGVLAGPRRLIVAARLNSATPSAGNSFPSSTSSAACFIGGRLGLRRASGKVLGVVIGRPSSWAVMNNGMSILGIGIYWQYVVKRHRPAVGGFMSTSIRKNKRRVRAKSASAAFRHCDAQLCDEAMQSLSVAFLDCFASLAMTG